MTGRGIDHLGAPGISQDPVCDLLAGVLRPRKVGDCVLEPSRVVIVIVAQVGYQVPRRLVKAPVAVDPEAVLAPAVLRTDLVLEHPDRPEPELSRDRLDVEDARIVEQQDLHVRMGLAGQAAQRVPDPVRAVEARQDARDLHGVAPGSWTRKATIGNSSSSGPRREPTSPAARPGCTAS